MNMLKFKFLLLSTLLSGVFQSALACPLVDGYVDYNCDGKIRIAITGDSIVKGIGDERELGGYPGRLRKKLSVEVENIGVPGATAFRLLRDFKRNIDRGRKTTRKTEDLDYLFIEVGTNDYWGYRNEGRPLGLTLRDIRRLKKYLESKLLEKWKVAPQITLSTLPPVKRSYQQPFIDSLNRLIRGQKRKLNVEVFFDRLPRDIIGEDELHPNARGYQRMANLIKKSYARKVQKKASRTRSDLDNDGLYDEIEQVLYSCDPALADTDGDTLLDGEEVLEHGTDPTTMDTDGDGHGDSEEIENGTDPNDAEDPSEEEESS